MKEFSIAEKLNFAKRFLVILLIIILPLLFTGCAALWGDGSGNSNSPGNNNPPGGDSDGGGGLGLPESEASRLSKVITVYIPETPSQASIDEIKLVRKTVAEKAYNILLVRVITIDVAIANPPEPPEPPPALSPWFWQGESNRTLDYILNILNTEVPEDTSRVGLFDDELDAFIAALQTEIIGIANNYLEGKTDEQVLTQVKADIISYLSNSSLIGGSIANVTAGGVTTQSAYGLIVRSIVEIDIYDVQIVKTKKVASGFEYEEEQAVLVCDGVTYNFDDDYYMLPAKQYIGMAYILKQNKNNPTLYWGGIELSVKDWSWGSGDADPEFKLYYNGFNAPLSLFPGDEALDFGKDFNIDDMDNDSKAQLLEMIEFLKTCKSTAWYVDGFNKTTDELTKEEIAKIEAKLQKVKTGVYAEASQSDALNKAILSCISINYFSETGEIETSFDNRGLKDVITVSFGTGGHSFKVGLMVALYLSDKFPMA